MQDSTPRILVVEDEPGLSQLINYGLSQKGFDPQSVLTGEDAMAAYDENAPEIILLDVYLPGISGFDVCRMVRQERGDTTTPIIMLTGADDVSSISRAFEIGATDFLTKPINLPLLVERIRYALRNRDNERSLRKALYFQGRAGQLASLGYWAFDYTRHEFVFNQHARTLLHLSDKGYSHEDIMAMLHPEDRGRVEAVLLEQREAEMELRMTLAEVGERIIRFSASMDYSDGVVMHGAFQDISDQRSTEDMLIFLRLHDDLTGLPNEKMLVQHLRDYAQPRLASGPKPILSKISLPGYGRMVEVFGQQRVDTLIKQIGNDFKRHLRLHKAAATLYYLGSGRFALLSRFKGSQETEVALNALLALADQERLIDQELMMPTLVCSALEINDFSLEPDVYFQRARLALNQAEADPGNGVYWFRDATSKDMRRELQMEQAVKRAVHEQRVELFLQPQILLNQSRRVWGFEALIRWVDESGQTGLHSPGEFLPIVERMGLMVLLGQQIIDKAFEKARLLQEAGLDVRLGVNLAAQQFSDENLVPYILEALERFGISSNSIEFEITESTAMADPEATLLKLKTLREAGFHLAIDDFGIGYSSMEYLLRFPITTLKIDRAFVTEVTTKPEVRAIVRAMVALASGLGLNTVAEGIENDRQQDYLDALGVDVLQGFYFAKALPMEHAIDFAKQFSGGLD